MVELGPTISVNKLRFHGHHGVTDEERRLGIQLVADIVAILDPVKAETTDDINDTISYIDLAEILIETSDARSFKTLEALARTYIDKVYERFPAIRLIRVDLFKPNPPTHLHLESVGVSLSAPNPKMTAQIRSLQSRYMPNPPEDPMLE